MSVASGKCLWDPLSSLSAWTEAGSHPRLNCTFMLPRALRGSGALALRDREPSLGQRDCSRLNTPRTVWRRRESNPRRAVRNSQQNRALTSQSPGMLGSRYPAASPPVPPHSGPFRTLLRHTGNMEGAAHLPPLDIPGYVARRSGGRPEPCSSLPLLGSCVGSSVAGGIGSNSCEGLELGFDRRLLCILARGATCQEWALPEQALSIVACFFTGPPISATSRVIPRRLLRPLGPSRPFDRLFQQPVSTIVS